MFYGGVKPTVGMTCNWLGVGGPSSRTTPDATLSPAVRSETRSAFREWREAPDAEISRLPTITRTANELRGRLPSLPASPVDLVSLPPRGEITAPSQLRKPPPTFSV